MSGTVTQSHAPHNVAADALPNQMGGDPEQGPFDITVQDIDGVGIIAAPLRKGNKRADGSYPWGSNAPTEDDTVVAGEDTGFDGTATATAGAQPSGIGPFNCEPADTIVVAVDGGGDETATFDAAGAFDQTKAATFDLADAETITLTIDAESEVQTITFLAADVANIDAVTALELAEIFNAQARGFRATVEAGDVRLTSDLRGTNSRLIVTGGTAAAELTFDGETVGTGDVADIQAVTTAEVKTIVEADTTAEVTLNGDGTCDVISPTTGAASTIEIKGASANAFGFAEDAVDTGGAAGVTTDFSGQALNTLPVLPFSARIRAVGGKVLYDKFGNGRLYTTETDLSTEVLAGEINYDTGALVLEYPAAPTAGAILADYRSAPAAGKAGQPGMRVRIRVRSLGSGNKLGLHCAGRTAGGSALLEISERRA
jgi:hypothetical protein